MYFISSLDVGVEGFSRSVKEHWGVESMHWNLGVTFSEDKMQSRKDYLPETLAVLKRIDIWDGSIDMNNGSDYITISNNYFINHLKTSLVGHNDENGDVDEGKLHITYINNWFDGTDQRHPRVRFGAVHILNNYYSGITQYGISGGVSAKLTVEKNYFENTSIPWRYHDTDELPAGLLAIDNFIDENSGNPSYPSTSKNTELVPTIPYSYNAIDKMDVRVTARVAAGANKAERISYVDDRTRLRAGQPDYMEIVEHPNYEISGSVLQNSFIRIKVNDEIQVVDKSVLAKADFAESIVLNEGMNQVTVTVVSGEIEETTTFLVNYGNKYKVSFESNGGNSVPEQLVVKGMMVNKPADPKRDGYSFRGWYTDKELHSPWNFNNMVEANIILYAKWQKNDPEPESTKFQVRFDGNNGTKLSQSRKNVTNGEKYGSLPSVERKGYTFKGWYTAQSSGSRITAETTVKLTSDQTLYAQWTANKYQVKFNKNNGAKLSQSSKNVVYGKTYGKLPTVVRKGYLLKGWYTKKSGGSKITAQSKVNITGIQTLYAHWTKVAKPKKASMSKLSNKSPKTLVVKVKKVNNAKGYEIRYATNKSFKNAKKKNTTKLSTSLKLQKKTYYVKVRAYRTDSAGNKVYGSFSNTQRIKITK